MARGYEAHVTVYDEHENVVGASTAFGESAAECSIRAGILRYQMERAARSAGIDGANGFVEEPRRC